MATQKRAGSLLGAAKAAAGKVDAEESAPPPALITDPAQRRFSRDSARMVTTAIHIPHEALALLRRVAVERANRDGGRPSVSGVIADLVEAQRAELEREAKG